MFPLPIVSDLKLRASCANSGKKKTHKDRETDSQKNSKTKLERKRKWLGKTQRGSEFEEEVKRSSSESGMCFGELRSLDMILCIQTFRVGPYFSVWVHSFMLLTRIG